MPHLFRQNKVSTTNKQACIGKVSLGAYKRIIKGRYVKTDYELLGRRGNNQLILSLQALRAETNVGGLFQVLGSRCLTGSALLDCHVLKGFGIYMIGILDS